MDFVDLKSVSADYSMIRGLVQKYFPILKNEMVLK
jgi:hypothetical protein